MHILTHTEKLDIDTERLIRRIPFFNSVYEASVAQFTQLMDLSEIICVDASETVIRKGDGDMTLYFLLKGQLGVYLDEECTGDVINSINPGEVFGILSMVSDSTRTAYIKADANGKEAILFRLDFRHIADESGQSPISLPIKLLFYRMAVHNIRWMLELNKMSDPNHQLVAEIRKLPFIQAEKDTKEELQMLKQQAKSLSDILFLWNKSTTEIKADTE